MPSLPSNDQRVDLRAPRGDVTRWRAAAAAEKMTLSDWIRRTLDARVEAGARRRRSAR